MHSQRFGIGAIWSSPESTCVECASEDRFDPKLPAEARKRLEPLGIGDLHVVQTGVGRGEGEQALALLGQGAAVLVSQP